MWSRDHSLVVLGSMSHRSVQWVTNLHLLHFANLQSGETTSWIPAQHGRVWTERTFSGHFQSHSPFWPKTHHGCSAQQTGDLVWKSSAHYSQREREKDSSHCRIPRYSIYLEVTAQKTTGLSLPPKLLCEEEWKDTLFVHAVRFFGNLHITLLHIRNEAKQPFVSQLFGKNDDSLTHIPAAIQFSPLLKNTDWAP